MGLVIRRLDKGCGRLVYLEGSAGLLRLGPSPGPTSDVLLLYQSVKFPWLAT